MDFTELFTDGVSPRQNDQKDKNFSLKHFWQSYGPLINSTAVKLWGIFVYGEVFQNTVQCALNMSL